MKIKRSHRSEGMSRVDARFSTESVNLLTAILIWLLGVNIYVPAAFEVEQTYLPMICSLTILVAFSFFIFKGARSFNLLLSSLLSLLLGICQRRGVKASPDNMRAVFKGLTSIITVLILYCFYQPLLMVISPTVEGLLFTFIILWILYTVMVILGRLK